MRGILSSAIVVVTFACVVVLLWRQRSRHRAHVQAKIDSYWDASKENRKFRRFKKELSVDCTIPEKPGDTYKTFTSDISGQGICLKVPEIVPQGGVLNLLVSIPDRKPIKITGEVVWVNEIKEKVEGLARAFNAGIKFLKIDKHDQKILDKFLIESAK